MSLSKTRSDFFFEREYFFNKENALDLEFFQITESVEIYLNHPELSLNILLVLDHFIIYRKYSSECFLNGAFYDIRRPFFLNIRVRRTMNATMRNEILVMKNTAA